MAEPGSVEREPTAEERLRHCTEQAKSYLDSGSPDDALACLMPEFEEVPTGVKSISYTAIDRSRTEDIEASPLWPRLSEEELVDPTSDFEDAALLSEACLTLADALSTGNRTEEQVWQARMLYEEAASIQYRTYASLLDSETPATPDALQAFNRAASASMKRIDTFKGQDLPAHEEEPINRLVNWADRIQSEEVDEARKMLHTIQTEICIKRFEDAPSETKRELLQEAGNQLKKLLPWGEAVTEIDQRAAFVLKEGLERIEETPIPEVEPAITE